jgi:two-component system, chemotaxis family, chemotaxis protein CheY
MELNILIVDDSPVMRAFIKRVLAMSGLAVAQTLEASDGRQAIDVLKAQHVDLVLSDINMPVMNGEEFLREMMANETLRGTPVVVISTDARLDRVMQMISLGARGYVAKPFSPEGLRAELERAMGVVNA